MPKVTPADIKDLGFVDAAYGRDPSNFEPFLNAIIVEQSALLTSRIGATAYASVETDTAMAVKRAEKCLVAAELLQRRINKLAFDISTAEGDEALKVRRQRKEYLDEAETMISRVASGAFAASGSDYAGSVLESSHYDSAESV